MTTNHQWRLAKRPTGLIQDGDFTWVEEPAADPTDGELLVRNVYLSLDPTNRVWINESDSYLPAVAIGDVMRGGAIGVVEASKNDRFVVGDCVAGMLGWQTHALTDGRELTKIPRIPGIPLTAGMGLFGHIGVTAYFGLVEIGQPKEGQTLVVSAAAGAVGSLVAQIGKIKGCRVVGIAGADDKCAWLTDDLGIDAAINYKTENVRDALKRHCPNGIDVYFENVGGDILEAVMGQINIGARIPLCGLISYYTAANPKPLSPGILGTLIEKRARMEGFLVLDYMARHDECAMQLGQWYLEGKLKYRIDIVEGLEQAPLALNKLFEGSNTGKLVVQISEEPA